MTPTELSGLTCNLVQKERLASELGLKAGAVIGCVGGSQIGTDLLGTGVGPQTPMEIGSLTKAFTGLLLADSILRGELREDTQVDVLLFGAQARETGIRVIDLATHTSGLPRLSVSPLRGLLGDPYRNITRDHIHSWWQKHKPQRLQHATFAYSNLGFAVLGLALESASGKTYADLLRERLLQPLGLSNTRLQLSGSPALVERGYGRRGNRPKPWRHDAYAPAGGLVSTATDITKFLQALLDPESPLRPALKLATSPHADATNGTIGYAWLTPRGAEWAWHNGATYGYSSFLALDYVKRCGVVVLSNRSVPQPITHFGSALMQTLLKTCDDDIHDAG